MGGIQRDRLVFKWVGHGEQVSPWGKLLRWILKWALDGYLQGQKRSSKRGSSVGQPLGTMGSPLLPTRHSIKALTQDISCHLTTHSCVYIYSRPLCGSTRDFSNPRPMGDLTKRYISNCTVTTTKINYISYSH